MNHNTFSFHPAVIKKKNYGGTCYPEEDSPWDNKRCGFAPQGI